MRLQVLSDLHLEFHGAAARHFCEHLDLDATVDALVLAGDTGVLRAPLMFAEALDALSKRVPRVLLVAGNHELYGSPATDALELLRRLVSVFPSVTLLEPGVVVRLGERRVLGCTLWFKEAPPSASAATALLSDFRAIEGFAPWVYEENERHRAWLAQELGEGDVVVTHHLPDPSSVSPRWLGSPLNPFFVCDQRELIADRRPSAWIHGHTHESCDYLSHRTRVVCNPFGYVGSEENPGFVPRLVVEV